MIRNLDFYERLFVVLMAILQPFIIYWYCDDIVSLSASWYTPLQPLFIMTNAMVSYFFFNLPKWKVTAGLLLLLTAFSVQSFPNFHNVIAILFFVSCVYPLLSIKKFQFYLPIYLLSIIIGLFFGLFWLETYGIIVLCIYHLHLLLYTHSLFRDRPNRS